MKLSQTQLRKLVLDEVKALMGKEKDVEDVKTKEVAADELADTLAAKKDFTVKEVRALKVQEMKLAKQLQEVRSQLKEAGVK